MNIDLKSRRVRLLGSVVISLLAMVALSRLRVLLPQHDEDPSPTMLDEPGMEIHEGLSVSQEFIAEDDNITGITLMLATYGRENPGTLKLEVAKRRKRKWLPLTTVTLEKRLLADNAYRTFSFPEPLDVRIGDKILLTLSADGPLSSAITWRVYPELELPGYRMRVGEEVIPGTAAFKVTYFGAAGRVGGPNMRGRVWKRITVFLHAPGQLLLGAGFLLALFGFVALLSAPVPERAPEGEPGSRDS